MFEHFHCFFFSAYSDDILTILFVEIVLCFAIDILATYPQPYPWTRAGVGQSSQDAESQTYPACSGELSLLFRPLLLFVYILPRVSLTLTPSFPLLLPSPGCSPSLGGSSHCSFLHCWHRWQLFPLHSSVCLQCLQHITSGRFLFSILAT